MNRGYSRRRLPIVLLLPGLLPADGSPAHAQETAAPVVAALVTEQDVETGHRVVGTVFPIRTSTVGSAVDGRVVDFPVTEGDAVREGEPLARLRTETLEIELASAEAALKVREEELAELENGSLPEEIAAARARMRAAEAAMKAAESRLERAEALFRRNAFNQAEVDDAREQAQTAREAFLAAEAAWQLVEAGPRAEQIAQARAQVELQRAQVQLIEDRIAKHTIVAPFDGFIASEHTEVGAWISQGDPLAQVIQLSEVEIRAPTPAEHAVRLRRNATVRVEFPELSGEIFLGTVSRIVPMAELSTRAFPVHVRLENQIDDDAPLLMAGMLARLELPTGARKRLPLVPKDALVLNGPRREVFVIDERSRSGQGVVRSVPVELGVADGERIQVDGPLRAGQLVVVRGNERLRDGQTVRITRVLEPAEGGSE